MIESGRSISSPNPCTFCEIICGNLPETMVYEDAVSVVFLDHRPLLKGHCLVVPKQHCETLLDLPASQVGPLFLNVQLLAKAVEQGLKADGSFLAVNNWISQSVPHLHIHIVPRWKKDGLFSKKLVWKRQPYVHESIMSEIRKTIRRAIEQIQSNGNNPSEVE